MNIDRTDAASQADIGEFKPHWDNGAVGWNRHAAAVHERLADATAGRHSAPRGKTWPRN